MLDDIKREGRSRALALRLYDKWVRERQRRGDLVVFDDPDRDQLEEMQRENFARQLAEPRRSQIQDLREVGEEVEFADQVGLLVMMELPTLETSSLLHRLSRQVADDPEATYFSKVNMGDNCGCGCGCGCAAMVDFGYEERIVAHYQTKPFSIDPFNEMQTPDDVRDALLARDFLASYEKLSGSVGERVNARYFRLASDFTG